MERFNKIEHSKLIELTPLKADKKVYKQYEEIIIKSIAEANMPDREYII